MSGDHEPGARVGRLEQPTEPADQALEPLAPAQQDVRPLVAASLRGLAHLRLQLREELVAAPSLDKWPQRLVKPSAVEVRVEIAQARR